MSPEKTELAAVLPPRVRTRVPVSVVLFVGIRMMRPTSKAPPMRMEASAFPPAVPSTTSELALPNAPAAAEGAFAPATSVPALTVVTPV
jgi:hypothetical protein